MKPVALLTCDDSPDYLFLLPIVAKSWELQGFEVMPVVISDKTHIVRPFMDKYMKGVRAWSPDKTITSRLNPALYVQCVRLYIGRNRPKDQYCIIGDADMVIASSFLYRDFDKVNVFGHDLTDFNEIPMCYVGMTGAKWIEVIGTGNYPMKEDLEKHSKYKSKVWHEAWGADQQILTAKLKAYGFDRVNFINRRDPNAKHNIPAGRLDRSNNFVMPGGEIHDVHLMREPYTDHNIFIIQEIMKVIYSRQGWEWIEGYADDFKKTFKVAEYATQE